MVVLVVDDARGEAAAEEVAVTAVACIEVGCIAAVQEVHAVRELLSGALDEHVVVRTHEAERDDVPAEALDGGKQQQIERQVVLYVPEEQRVGYGTAAAVVYAVGELLARDARHLRDEGTTADGRIRACG